MRKKFIVFSLFVFYVVHAQQFNCTVTIDAQKMVNPNQQIFKTLQTSLTEFVNKTDWTGQAMKPQERINGSFYITLLSGEANEFSGTIQVQSSRPIFDSSYSSPILNFNDKDFSFKYNEFDNFIYDSNSFDSNLVAVISFYCYVMLGLDADSFVEQSGTPHFESAQNIANLAQQSSYKGWGQADGNQNRYFLITDLLSPTYSEVRIASFNYNTGLDGMSKDLKKAKEKIKTALLDLSKINSSRPNAFLTRLFFDAKSDEIAAIFSGGPNINVKDLVNILNQISPINSNKWSTIR